MTFIAGNHNGPKFMVASLLPRALIDLTMLNMSRKEARGFKSVSTFPTAVRNGAMLQPMKIPISTVLSVNIVLK